MKIALCILLVLFVVTVILISGIAIYVFSLSFHDTLNLLYYLEYGDDDE